MTAPQFIDQTPRDFLASLNPPLATAGVRGRFSKDATEALAVARADGFLFIGDAGHPKTEVKAVREPKAPKAPKQVVTGTSAAPAGTADPKAVRAWAQQNNVPVGERGRIKPEVVAQYIAANGGGSKPAVMRVVGSKPKPAAEAVKVRDEKTGYSVIGGTLIRQDTCGSCSKTIQFCGCKKGPQVHGFLAREAGQPVALILDTPK